MTVKGIDTDATEEEVVVPNDQQDLIDGLLSDEPVEEEVQEEEEVVEEKPEEKEEVVEEEVEEEKEEKEEPKVEEEETEEKPSEKEEEDEVTDDSPEQALVDANEKLRDQIIAMAEQGFGVKSPDVEEEKPSEEEEVPEEIEKPEPIKLEELKIEDFLTEDELDRVNDHPELLNAAFGRAMEAVLKQVSSALGVIKPLEQEVRALPKQVSEAVGEQLNFSTFINSFYDDNPDLKKASKVVHITYRSLATDAQKEGKKTPLGELYNQAGDEVRELLSIPKVAAKSGERKPALIGARTPKRRQKSQKASGEAKTQADLMAYLTSD